MHWKLWPYCSWVWTQIDSVHQPEVGLPLTADSMTCHIFKLLWVSWKNVDGHFTLKKKKTWRRGLLFLQHYKVILYWLVILTYPIIVPDRTDYISTFRKLKYLRQTPGIIWQVSRNGSESFWRRVTAIILLRNGHLHNHKHIYTISMRGEVGHFSSQCF